jgi:hypothetical protein
MKTRYGGSVNLTSAGDDAGEWGRGSGCGHRFPHTERAGSKHAMMHRPHPVSLDSTQMLHDAVDRHETLRVGG